MYFGLPRVFVKNDLCYSLVNRSVLTPVVKIMRMSKLAHCFALKKKKSRESTNCGAPVAELLPS